MTINDILKSKTSVASPLNILLVQTGKVKFPYVTERRDRVLRLLEEMNDQTLEKLDGLAPHLHEILSLDQCSLSETETYMLGQRVRCGLDFLTRLNDTQPSQSWLCAATDFLEEEDTFLFLGVWRQFGQYWLANLAWRLARGFES